MELLNNPYEVVTREAPTYTAISGATKEIPNLAAGVKGVVIGEDEQGDRIVLLDTERVEAINARDLDVRDNRARAQMWRDCLFLTVGDADDAIDAYWRHLGALTARARTATIQCAACRLAKPLEAFAMDAARRSGYAARCRDCERDRQANLRMMAAREQ